MISLLSKSPIKAVSVIPFVLLLASPFAAASSCQQSIPSDFKQVGETRLSVLFWDVYDAQLFTQSGHYDWQRRKQFTTSLSLTYLRDIEAKELVETTGEEWQKLGYDHEQQQQWLEQLNTLWPDIKEGDCLLLKEDDQGHAVFYQGTKKLGVVENADFTQQFLAIWLSPESRFKEERQELVGEK